METLIIGHFGNLGIRVLLLLPLSFSFSLSLSLFISPFLSLSRSCLSLSLSLALSIRDRPARMVGGLGVREHRFPVHGVVNTFELGTPAGRLGLVGVAPLPDRPAKPEEIPSKRMGGKTKKKKKKKKSGRYVGRTAPPTHTYPSALPTMWTSLADSTRGAAADRRKPAIVT